MEVFDVEFAPCTIEHCRWCMTLVLTVLPHASERGARQRMGAVGGQSRLCASVAKSSGCVAECLSDVETAARGNDDGADELRGT